jgi:hypothetical protein
MCSGLTDDDLDLECEPQSGGTLFAAQGAACDDAA